MKGPDCWAWLALANSTVLWARIERKYERQNGSDW